MVKRSNSEINIAHNIFRWYLNTISHGLKFLIKTSFDFEAKRSKSWSHTFCVKQLFFNDFLTLHFAMKFNTISPYDLKRSLFILRSKGLQAQNTVCCIKWFPDINFYAKKFKVTVTWSHISLVYIFSVDKFIYESFSTKNIKSWIL